MKYNQTPITNFNLTVPKKQTPITNFNLTVPKKQTKQQSYDCSQSLEMINNILNESFISNLKHNRKNTRNLENTYETNSTYQSFNNHFSNNSNNQSFSKDFSSTNNGKKNNELYLNYKSDNIIKKDKKIKSLQYYSENV